MLVAAQTVFPGNLHLPPSITFFTATVWNYKPSQPDVEPGSQDEWSAVQIRRNLERAVERAPVGSRLRKDLEARESYVYGSEQAIISRGGGKSIFHSLGSYVKC